MAYLGFKKLKGKLAHQPGVTNPGALAAYIGRKKYKPHQGESLKEASRRVRGAKKRKRYMR